MKCCRDDSFSDGIYPLPASVDMSGHALSPLGGTTIYNHPIFDIPDQRSSVGLVVISLCSCNPLMSTPVPAQPMNS